MPPKAETQILLVVNYLPDGQKSMLRFAAQLKAGLSENGVSAAVFQPRVVAGRIRAGTTGLGKWLGYIDKYLIAPIELRWRVHSLPAQNRIVHICDHSNAIYTKTLRRIPHLVTCHDLLAVRSALGEIGANRPRWTGRQQQAMILRGLKRSRMIVSVSQATLDDVQRLVGKKEDWLHSIPNSLDAEFIDEANRELADPKPRPPAKLALTAEASYVMHIGGEKWYKNRKAVLQIYAQLVVKIPDLHLVIVGPPFSESALKETGCAELADHIHYLNDISDTELRQLYRAAEMLLFPSIMEGFGWPILEAQACGCPVLTTGAEPMCSLNAIQELSVHVEMTSANDTRLMAEACMQYLDSPTKEKRIQSRKSKAFSSKFSNQASAKAYLELYQTLTSTDS